MEEQRITHELASINRPRVLQVRERGQSAGKRACETPIHQACGLADDSSTGLTGSEGDAEPRDSLQRGFTLLELSIVLFVIALTVSLTLPLLGKVGDGDLHAAGRRLAGTIKYLYNEAVLEKTTYRLIFDLDHGSYRAERQEAGGEWVKLPGRMGEKRELPGSVEMKRIFINGRGSFTSGEVSIQIYAAGWLDEAALYLQDGKYRQTLRISALTGTTEFYDGFRDFY